jgi:hypothetical protein
MLGRGWGKFLLAVLGLLATLPAQGAGAHSCSPLDSPQEERALRVEQLAGGCLDPLTAEPEPAPQPDPVPEVGLPAPKPFGFNQFGDMEATHEAALGKLAGGTHQRVSVAWRWLQYCPADPVLPELERGQEVPWNHPHPGAAQHLRLIDERYEALVAAGMTPIMHPYNAPLWAWKPQSIKPNLQSPDRSGCDDGNRPGVYWPRGAMLAAYARFVKRVAERYPKAIIDGWNEPNLDWHFEFEDGKRKTYVASPAEMTEIQCTLYAAVKAVDPNRLVLGPGFARTLDWEHFHQYVGGMLGLGAHRCWDAFNVHLYMQNSTDLGDEGNFAQGLADVDAVRAQFGDASPIWVTETGFTTVSTEWYGAVDEDAQRDASIGVYNVLMNRDDVDGVLFHTLKDRNGSGFGWLFDARQAGTPLPGFPGEEAYAPKKVYCEFVSLAGNTYPGCD